MRRRFAWLMLAAGGLVALAAACSSAPPEGGVHVLTADGVINPVMANYIERGIEQAEDRDAVAVVVRLDTPGGLDSSMRDIVQTINNADVPVIVYVAPSGARAASAGTFITMAGHVAAMAPNTAIGAAHPVGGGGEDIEGDLGDKVENDAVAYIRGIAELRDRNADWAERAVRRSVSVPENEAVELNVVDLVAPTTEQLLEAVDGRTVRLADERQVRLETAGAPLRENDMTLVEEFLLLLSDPNIAFILLSIGSLALVIEVFNPGALVPGITGAIALLLAFFSLGTLPVNWAGVALIVLAFVLLVAEVFVPSFGALGIGGIVALAFGGLLLTTSDNPEFEVDLWLVVGMPAVIGAAFAALVLFVFSSRHRAIAVGAEALIGAEAIARSPLAPKGTVLVRGERWRASSDEPIGEGDRVVVTGLHGLELSVRRLEASEPAIGTEVEPPQQDEAETDA